MKDMQFHEVANLLPLMPEAELDELAADIKQHGQREAIYTFEGKIVDGRNRYLACEQIGIEPVYREWSGDGSLTAFVVSENVKRRHLTSAQRALIGADLVPLCEQESRKRQGHGKTAPGRSLPEGIPEPSAGDARDLAAKAAGTNGHYITDVRTIQQTAPDLIPLLRDDRLTVQQARDAQELENDDRALLIEEMTCGATFEEAAEKLEEKATPAGEKRIHLVRRTRGRVHGKRKVNAMKPICDLAKAVELLAASKIPFYNIPSACIDEFDSTVPKAIQATADAGGT